MEVEDSGGEEAALSFYLSAFLPYIVQHVQAKDMIAYYELYTREQCKNIRQLMREKPNEAVQAAFDIIIDEIEDTDKCKYLLKMLDEAGYPKIAKILTGEAIPRNANNKNSIRKFTKVILDGLKIGGVVLPLLVSKDVLKSHDMEEINATLTNHGNFQAVLDLLSIFLPNRCTNWYRLFIEALLESDHRVLAQTIDKELCNEIDADNESGGSSGMSIQSVDDETACVQPVVPEVAPTPDVHTMMKEIHVKNPRDGPAHIPMENILYERFPTPQPSLANFQAPPPKQELSSQSMTEIGPIPNDNKAETPKSSTGEQKAWKKIPKNARPKAEISPLRQQLKKNVLNVDFHVAEYGQIVEELRREIQPVAMEIEEASDPAVRTGDETSVKTVDIPAIPDMAKFQLLHRESKPKPMDVERIQQRTAEDVSPNRESTGMRDQDIGGLDQQQAQLVSMPQHISEESSEQDDDTDGDTDISLRDYQTELAAEAILGKNVIIVAPTGSGKTRVALKIIQEHIRKWQGRRIAKVIFLANQVALANQQGEECMKLLKKYKTKVISGETQRTRHECLKDFIDKRDILVITPQVLLDSLVQKEIDSITKFSLMVFDECHHTHANHTFNQIMSIYMDLKLSENSDPTLLPQIVGLTASVGVGKAKNKEKAVEHILSLMANLDAEKICTVHNNMSELRDFVSIPEEETCTVLGRSNDIFGNAVTEAMTVIERLMSTNIDVTEMREWAEFQTTLKSPAQKGTVQYSQWLARLWKATAALRSQAARRFLNPCRAHLMNYNNSLIIYNDARVKDALSFLEAEMKKWKDGLIMDTNEESLSQIYQDLSKLSFKDCSSNPKLDKLKQLIMKAYRGKEKLEDSRGIIFVKTRDLSTAIVSWMKETSELKILNPIKFVGQNMGADKGGMTKVDQDDALKYFRDGKHKLIVATSVAEEGLDISKCNLVIRYDHVTNEIAMVQSRGRGRAQDSKYVVLAEQGSGMAEKEELNMIREILMRKAIIHLQEQIMLNPVRFRTDRYKLQEKAKIDRDLASITRKGRRIRRGEFELRCVKCDVYVTMSSDIKKIEHAHHVVMDEMLQDRVTFARNAEPHTLSRTTQQAGRLHCKDCGENLGGLIIYKGMEFPVIAIKNFLIMDVNGRQDTCKHWKNAPFGVRELTTEDFKEMLQARTDRGNVE